METDLDEKRAVTALAALAQETRLALFRLLVQAGPAGLPAGMIAERLAVQPSSLSFHLAQLVHAGLITQRRAGRQLIYSAEYSAMNALLVYLTENCCGRCAIRPPAAARPPLQKPPPPEETGHGRSPDQGNGARALWRHRDRERGRLLRAGRGVLLWSGRHGQ